MNKSTVLFCIFLLFSTKIFAQSDTIVRGAYMNIATDSSITILWRTQDSTNSEVSIGTSLGNFTHIFQDTNYVIDHSVHISGLLPSTKYFYAVGKIDTILQQGADYQFITAPLPNVNLNKLRFWVTGDFGTGTVQQDSVTAAFEAYNDTNIVNGWLWLGDNAYNSGTDADFQANNFDHYVAQMRKYPLFPAIGNHEYANVGYLSASALTTNFPYFDIFDIQASSNSEKYYSYDYGNIHFIAIDSYGAYNAPGSPMYTWLQNDLDQNTKKWTIAYFHHSPYTKGSHNSDTEIELIDMRTNIVPLLESKGVDLVLNGHSHIYERSYFMKGHYGLENTFRPLPYPMGNIVQAPSNQYYKSSRKGTIYVVCGVSGRTGGVTTAGFPHNAMQTSFAYGNGSLVLDISDDTLHCKYLTSLGTITDEFKIVKHFIMSGNPIREVSAFFDEGQILLKWNVQYLSPNTTFAIERSAGDNHFVKIGEVLAKDAEKDYLFVDEHPLKGLSFYQIKLLDADNYVYDVSDAVPYLWENLDSVGNVSLLQNPIVDRLLIYIHNEGDLQVHNINGQFLHQQHVGIGAQQIPTNAWEAGMYFLTFVSKGRRDVRKFVKI